MKTDIEAILLERFGDPIGSYAGDASVGVRSIEDHACATCGMKDCDCDHSILEDETCSASLGPCKRVESKEEIICSECGMMPIEGEGCGCESPSEAEVCEECGMMSLEGEGCGCTHLDEAKKKRRGLWANIHARRAAGKRPHKPGEKGYPKSLDAARKK